MLLCGSLPFFKQKLQLKILTVVHMICVLFLKSYDGFVLETSKYYYYEYVFHI